MTAETGGDQVLSSEALAERIKVCARAGEFDEAERLRAELMRIDPMALSLIVATGEFIEEQKAGQLDADHLAIWAELYESFSPEETNGLFYKLKRATVASGKLLVVQGKGSERLFFIESGRVTVFYRINDKNVPIIQLGRGDVLGEETFFGISLSSISAATQSEVVLRHLNRKDVATWPDDLPGLLDKVGDFCRRVGKSQRARDLKNLERRAFARYPVSGVATAVPLGQIKQVMNEYFKGGVIDLSRSGACFSVKCSKYETARSLLGQPVELTVQFDAVPDQSLKTRGTIVKVSFHLHNDYSVHVRLAETIDEATFNALPCNWSAGKA